MLSPFTFLLLIHFSTALNDLQLFTTTNISIGHTFHENILCRGCGNGITFSSSLISKISPAAQYSFRDSIFSKDEVLIQVLMSDFFLPLPIITTSQSNCVGVSEWEEVDSWFPGYRWKPCVCPECGTLVGWVFDRINPDIDQPEAFFGLILSTLISESFINSLIVTPDI